MKKLCVLETYFKTISDSMEWADSCKEKEYFNFIDGVTTMTQNILDSLNEVDCNEEDDLLKPRPEIVPRPPIKQQTNPFKEVLCRCIDTE